MGEARVAATHSSVCVGDDQISGPWAWPPGPAKERALAKDLVDRRQRRAEPELAGDTMPLAGALDHQSSGWGRGAAITAGHRGARVSAVSLTDWGAHLHEAVARRRRDAPETRAGRRNGRACGRDERAGAPEPRVLAHNLPDVSEMLMLIVFFL